ncbi:xanthine dehydrogenase family protein molybdopterin-binding subunit [Mycobacterium paraense]|uniref:xanthine dehydrogenase family protein molybdopterin-binding subunit n=1 Tax=Mycobacterium paraense TaxID=767916 RepID=UPI0019D40725|nr:molybdopterin cofactor-binding domain-containing protein [Mycobacterium paraense]
MPDLPESLAANPVLGEWVRIGPDGVIEVRSGKVELGQGVLTALAQIAAEELDVGVGRVRMIAASTDRSPDEGFTAGSRSIQQSGAALRQACAEARAIYLDAAAAKLSVAPDELDVADGEFSGPHGLATSYWELADDSLLDRAATGEATPKPESDYAVVGADVARLDLPDKLTGRPRYLHDLVMDGQLYGRVVRPPSRGARLREVNTEATLALPGVVTVARDGEFLGVIAEREEVAVRAAERLRGDATWERRPTLPDEGDLPGFLLSAAAETSLLASKEAAAPAHSTRSHSARYHRPYLAHASIGPSAAAALAHPDGRLEVWSHSQGVHVLRRELAAALGLPVDAVVVRHVEGAGCYGHNGADDAAMDAAVLARAMPGRPVHLVWSRADELAWAPFGPAAVVEIAADCGDDGAVLDWRHEIWSGSYMGRPGTTPTPAFLAASERAGGEPLRAGGEPSVEWGGGTGRNSVPGYDFPSYRVINHLLTEMPLRTSALRSLGAFINVFAAESFLDELAVTAGRDPLEFRLAQLSDERGRAVLRAAAERAGWPGRARRNPSGTVSGMRATRIRPPTAR